MKTSTTIMVIMTGLSLMMAGPLQAADDVLTQRIERLERIVKGQGLISLLSRVDQLQNEVKRLNGDNEALRYQIEQLQQRQRDMYSDLEQRMSQAAPSLAGSPADTTMVDQNSSDSEGATLASQAPTQTTITGSDSYPVSVENGEAAYQAALQTLRNGQYEQAVSALSAFPQQYPHSSYLPNVYYWLGEAHYVLRNFDKANASFQTVITDFPTSNKVADATLKLGFSQTELGQIEQAKQTLQSVIERYPATSAAQLAKARLDRMQSTQR